MCASWECKYGKVEPTQNLYFYLYNRFMWIEYLTRMCGAEYELVVGVASDWILS